MIRTMISGLRTWIRLVEKLGIDEKFNHTLQYCKLKIIMLPSNRTVYMYTCVDYVCARACVCLTLRGPTLRLTRPGKNPRTDLVVDIKMQVVRACAPFAWPDISVL